MNAKPNNSILIEQVVNTNTKRNKINNNESNLQYKQKKAILIQQLVNLTKDLLLSLGNYNFSQFEKKNIFTSFLKKLKEVVNIYNKDNFFNVKENIF